MPEIGRNPALYSTRAGSRRRNPRIDSRNEEKKICTPTMTSVAASTAMRSSDSAPNPRSSHWITITAATTRPASVIAHFDVLGRTWDLHALIAGSLFMIVGTQVLALGLCAHAYGTYFMNEKDPWFDRMRARFRLEHGLLLGGLLTLAGFGMGLVIVAIWVHRGFGALAEERLGVLAATLMIVGIQIFFSSFLLSILGLRRRC